MAGVNHLIACREETCPVGQANERAMTSYVRGEEPEEEGTAFYEGRIVSQDGKAHEKIGDELVEIRCSTCGKVMNVVHVALNVGRSQRSTSTIDGGVQVTSSNRSVCAQGREIVGASALRNVRPGETRTVAVGGAVIRATRSTGGRNVDLVRADR
ncbi:MAG: hypothetical protein WCT53_00560 [Candidatus Gracilibacteria bacterium]